MAPGDKFGYVDLDAEPPVPGEPVYSIWRSIVGDFMSEMVGAQSVIYSRGTISTAPGDTPIAHGSPTGTGSAVPDLPFTRAFVYAEPGASGSLTMSARTHHAVLGPDSKASLPSFNYGAYRLAASMDNIFRVGAVTAFPADRGVNEFDIRYERSYAMNPYLNRPLLHQLIPDIHPNNFFGPVDPTGDKLFGVQTEIELRTGETNRDVYWLGFESRRRNRLWGLTGTRLASATATSSSVVEAGKVLEHSRLNLSAGRYRLNFLAGATALPTMLSVRLRSRDGTTMGTPLSFVTSEPKGQPFTGRLMADADGAILEFSASRPVFVREIALVRDDAVFDFDIHDKRVIWYRDDGRRSQIIPNGRPRQHYSALLRRMVDLPGPTWAGRCPADYAGWSLTSHHLGLIDGEFTIISFYAKAQAGPCELHVDYPTRRRPARSTSFQLTSNWQQYSFAVVGEAGTPLRFRAASPTLTDAALVDQISLSPG